MTILLGLPPMVRPAEPSGCSLSFPAAYRYEAATGPWNTKRVYLYPGFTVDLSQWDSGTPLDLTTQLRASGYDVILMPLPVPQQCFFSTGGWLYREQFVSALNVAMNAIEALRGPASKNIVGGISFGGLHAMMGMASSGRFSSWFAHVPVTRIDALTEMTGIGDSRRFNPFFDVGSLNQTHGRIAWGTADTRVNYQLTIDLSARMSASVTKVAYPGQDHSTNAQNVTDIIAWVGP